MTGDHEHPLDDDLDALDDPRGADAPEPDEFFDAQVAAAMMQHAAHEETVRAMRRLGERMGALYAGLVGEGMDEECAGEIAHSWMLNAVFQATARETGTLGM